MNYNDKVIGIAADHAGFELKEVISAYLSAKGFEVRNFGTNSDKSCDYPDYAHPLANEINNGTISRGISICGSGNGISMVVNKYPFVRAALCWNTEIAVLARAHNDANILSLPARFININEAFAIIEAFLTTPFEGGRHIARINKIPISNITQ